MIHLVKTPDFTQLKLDQSSTFFKLLEPFPEELQHKQEKQTGSQMAETFLLLV
jgi:hypothetical protein